MALSRRRLLAGAAAGGGLLVGWELLPRHDPPPLAAGMGETAPGQTALTAWLRIGRDGITTVAVPQLEMGQGISSLIARIVAVELGADWRQVAAEPAPVSEIWGNPVLAARWAEMWLPLAPALGDGWLAQEYATRERFMVTADGTSLAAYESPARIAAATARCLLAKAAAARWGVAWRECDSADSTVRHGGRWLAFADLAESAADHRAPDTPPLRAAISENVAESMAAPLRFPRLDLPAMANGAQQFAGDIRLPGMVYAAIRHPPIGRGAALGDVDAGAAKGVSGFLRLVRSPAGASPFLAAVASDWWAAERALGLIAPEFTLHAPVDGVRIEAALDQALRHGDGVVIAGDGAPIAQPSLTQRYDVSPAVHAGIETATATARLAGGRLELWVAAQAPETVRRACAAALGMATRDVVLYPVNAGGSFDARLDCPHAVEAALIARAIGRPVQLMWSRWQEMLAGVTRPPVAAQLSARLDGSGAIAAWSLRAALPAAAREFGQRLFGGADRDAAMAAATSHSDPLALAGAVPPYSIPDLRIEHVPVATGLPAGRLRGNAHGYTAFFTESFIDELAAGLHREPLSFRMAMLAGDARLAQCLQAVSTLAAWNGGHDGSGQGLACHRIGTVESGGAIAGGVDNGGVIAAVATARREAGGVRVDRISAVADIGRIVDLDIARQQIEGGLVFGIGLALGCVPGYDSGLPLTGRLGALGLPVLADCPEIAVEFIASNAAPADPGELGVAVAAPAIANALFSATGIRFRKLPLEAEE